MERGFWGKVGRAGKYLTDPKQILTAAGFALGGPMGAGVGRAVGGAVPDWYGERESTLADGAQLADLGSAAKDFASGYGAGTIGQQVPGVQNLEGAFSGGASAGAGMGAEAMAMNNPGFMQTPGFGDVSSVGAPPMMSGAAGAQNMSYGGSGANGQGVLQNAGLGTFADPTGGMGAEAMAMNSPGFMQAPGFMQTPGTKAENFVSSMKDTEAVPQGGGFFGDMTGLEKMYAINMAANLGSSMFAGPRGIGAGGMEMLGQQGLFSRAPQRQIGSFDDWKSKRGTYAG